MSLIEGLFDVSGKTVVVTGGSRGIGYMIARGFVEGGATVVISARKAEACDEAARELSEFGTCISHPADLSTDEGIESLAAKVAEISPTLDVLVNNAGATWGAPVDDFPAAGFDKIFRHQCQGDLPLDSEAVAAVAFCRHGGRSRARDQYRIDRRTRGVGFGELLVRRQ